jgi:hypothetical protein
VERRPLFHVKHSRPAGGWCAAAEGGGGRRQPRTFHVKRAREGAGTVLGTVVQWGCHTSSPFTLPRYALSLQHQGHTLVLVLFHVEPAMTGAARGADAPVVPAAGPSTTSPTSGAFRPMSGIDQLPGEVYSVPIEARHQHRTPNIMTKAEAQNAERWQIGTTVQAGELPDDYVLELADSSVRASLETIAPEWADKATGVLVAVGEGDHTEVWATEASKPWSLAALYERVA